MRPRRRAAGSYLECRGAVFHLRQRTPRTLVQALMPGGWLAVVTALGTALIGGVVAYIVVRGTGRGTGR